MPSACSAARSAGGCLTTKPPFEPIGTMTAFLTTCAFIRPRISVRKSSRRSDQRMPPRATLPARRCTPSIHGARDENLDQRARQRQQVELGAVEFHREIGFRRAVLGLEEIGAQRMAHQRQERAQDAVVVEAGDLVESGFDLGRDALGRGRAVARARGRSAGGTASTSLAAMPPCRASVSSI